MSDSLIAKSNKLLADIKAALVAIGTSTTPVPTNATIKNGNYTFVTLGAPSISNGNNNQIVYSNPIAPNGEKLSFSFSMFTTGDRALGTDAFIFLECDLAGSTAYKQVHGTKRLFSDANYGGVNPKQMVVTFDNIKGGNFRVGINFGTGITGTTGSVGYNVSAVN